MVLTLVCPTTPSGPSSSASSSSSWLLANSLASPTQSHPPYSSNPLLRTPPPRSYPGVAQQHLYTPPSSPSLAPLQPTPTSSKTLHLRSPHKPTISSSDRSIIPLPAGSPTSFRRTKQQKQHQHQLIVKGNVTPSRASAFFAPRTQRRELPSSCTPSSTRGYYASLTSDSPSRYTSARRGMKRQRRPEDSMPKSPSSSRRGRRDRMILEGQRGGSHWDDSSDDDQEEEMTINQGVSRRWFDTSDDEEDITSMFQPSSHSVARRAATSPSVGSAARRAGLGTSQGGLPQRGKRTSSFDTDATPSPCKPVPMAMRAGQVGGMDLAAAMATVRCGAGAGPAGRGLSAMTAIRNRVSHVSAYQRYRSAPDGSVYTFPSLLNGGETLRQPLACAYSHSSRSYASSRQWLAVGDNEGALSLLDTSRDQTLPTYHSFHDGAGERPTWQATVGSLFSVSWRFDDIYLASSGSDYTTKIWDTSTLQCVHSFVGSRGTSRAMEWDPHSDGNLLASGGRDGAVHVYDLRMARVTPVLSTSTATAGGTVLDENDSNRIEATSPLLSLWSAHALSPALTAAGYRSRANAATMAAKGVTSLVYHPHRSHSVFTAGCADATIKLWDLRFAVAHKEDEQKGSSGIHGIKNSGRTAEVPRLPFSDLSALTNSSTDTSKASVSHSSAKRKMRKPRKARPGDPSFVLSTAATSVSSCSSSSLAGNDCPSFESTSSAAGNGTGLASDPLEIKALYETGDLSLGVGKGWNARSHGISCLTEGGGRIYAAVTDGRIYSLPLSSLTPSSSSNFHHDEETTVLYHPTQLGNSLYNRLALCPNERTLAIGCNNGNVVLWDTKVAKAAVLGQGTEDGSSGGTHGRRRQHRRSFTGQRDEETDDDDDDDDDDGTDASAAFFGSSGGRHSSHRQHPHHHAGRREVLGGVRGGGGLRRAEGARSIDGGASSRQGHRLNAEINALDWCYDAYAGWRLATCGDDLTIRVWESELGSDAR